MRIVVSLRLAPDPATGEPTDIVSGLDVQLVDAPRMYGSPRQCAWADRIRRQSVELLARERAENVKIGAATLATIYRRTPEVDEAVERLNRALNMTAAGLEKQGVASDWINAIEGGSLPTTARVATFMSHRKGGR